MRFFALFVTLALAFALNGCFVYRAPTTSLEVVDAMPAGAVRVGSRNLMWTDSNGCHSPSDDVVRKAETWGADVLVPDDARPGRRFCRATAYSTNAEAANPGRDWKGDPGGRR